MQNVSYKPIIISVIAQAALGALWYSPILFLHPWIVAQNKTLEAMNSSDPIPFVINFAYSVAYTLLLAKLLSGGPAKSPTAACGAKLGAAVSIGFVGLSLATHYSFLQLSGVVIAVDVAKEVVMGVMTGAILGAGAKRGEP